MRAGTVCDRHSTQTHIQTETAAAYRHTYRQTETATAYRHTYRQTQHKVW